MNNKFLETKNITKTFGKLKALDDVNFNLYRGKIHGLLGENGAGKSSLMNVLSGIYKPEKGIIYLDGQRQNISIFCFSPTDTSEIISFSFAFSAKIYEYFLKDFKKLSLKIFDLERVRLSLILKLSTNRNSWWTIPIPS